jgi:hypothetical protein
MGERGSVCRDRAAKATPFKTPFGPGYTRRAFQSRDYSGWGGRRRATRGSRPGRRSTGSSRRSCAWRRRSPRWRSAAGRCGSGQVEVEVVGKLKSERGAVSVLLLCSCSYSCYSCSRAPWSRLAPHRASVSATRSCLNHPGFNLPTHHRLVDGVARLVRENAGGEAGHEAALAVL